MNTDNDSFDARQSPSKNQTEGGEAIRIQKAIAAAGISSRRNAEIMIEQGRVRVNGQLLVDRGTRVTPGVDSIEIDGKPVQLDTRLRYVMLNKPFGIISSLQDENDRPDLRQFTRHFSERLYNVGRLDRETTGLLLLTNDGAIAQTMSHPSFLVPKSYKARIEGALNGRTIALLKSGIELDDGIIACDQLRVDAVSPDRSFSLLTVTLHSGKNRIVRRMLSAVSHPVRELSRTKFGPLHLGTLGSGRTRELDSREISSLLELAKQPSEKRK